MRKFAPYNGAKLREEGTFALRIEATKEQSENEKSTVFVVYSYKSISWN